jgi:cytochrome P450
VKIQDFDDSSYDPFFSDEVMFGNVTDPYAQIARWRAKGPVMRGSFREMLGVGQLKSEPPETYMVMSAEEIATVLTDTTRFSNACYIDTMGATFGMGSLSVLDGSEHGRWRGIFQKIFTPRQIQSWGDAIIGPVIDRLIGQFADRGHADLVGEFTLHYPFEIIYAQLNLPAEDTRTLHRLSIAQTDYMHPHMAVEASTKLGSYFSELIVQRRAQPGEDLVSLLATTEVDGEYLPERVLVSFFRQLLNAGGDTTYRGTSVLLAGLLQNSDQLAALQTDRNLVAKAVEEALRWDGPVSVQTRMAIVETELAGVRIPAGATLDLLTGYANRDPSLHRNPDQFDIFRERKAHFAFARGPHMCLGQHLARLEMSRAINALLDRLPGLRLDPNRPPAQILGCYMRVPRHLYVRFGE